MEKNLLPYSFPIRSAIEISPQFVDGVNHVNNVGFTELYDRHRRTFIIDYLSYRPDGEDSPLLAAVNMRFLCPLVFPGTVDMGLGVQRIGNSSFVIAQAMFVNEICVGTCEGVFVNHSGHGPAPISATRRGVLEQHLLKTG